MKSNVHVVRHPLVQHKLTLMRKKTTSVTEFRELVGEVAMLMAYEVTKDLPLTKTKIQTPMERMMSPVLQGEKMVLVPILRAGMGLLDGLLRIAATDRLKGAHPRSIRFMCLVSAPEGVRAFRKAHPDVPIYTAAIDRKLNAHGYILPGLGDAGDRIFGTI